MNRTIFLPTILCLFSLSSAFAGDYEKDILPLLEDRCLDCHGPDKQKSEFRVDQRAVMLKGGDSGLPGMVPGKPEESFLIELIKSTDEDERMPPKGDALTTEQISLLENWITEGAEWPGQMDAVIEETIDHWSFLPVVRPPVPGNEKNPIDAFLNTALENKGLTANDAADARSLIRRAATVLTGLPPTPERVAAFEQAYQKNPDSAYTTLVDELLSSPHFGERWAQHWLDVIRWAETNGSEANLYRKNAWIYRDYVVRAFNDDLPYNQFVTEQLAGDQLGAGEATGFLVAGPHVPAATVGREPTAIRQARADRMDEIMQTVGASLLGVTVSCARCHNHKFDPISIKDYYSLTAVFQGVEFGGRFPEFSKDHPRRLRAEELRPQLVTERNILREGIGFWDEDWGGYKEMQFAPVNTKVLRIDFESAGVGVDELQVYGPANWNENLALATTGVVLKHDPNITQKNGPIENANDGKFGTMAWRSKAPKGGKDRPWVEIHFPSEQKVNRFRYSSNREYYFETDYLDKSGKSYFPPFRVSALQADGSWKELGSVKKAMQKRQKNAELKDAYTRLHELIKQVNEEGPKHSFVGSFSKPKTTFVLHRGSPENPRGEVPPAAFDLLEGDLGLDASASGPERRKRFADWVIDPKNPLTARVMMNRVWHHIFGAGIVPTGGDFGKAGAAPSHPELLDWMASEFVENKNWSTKSMIRLLVTSDAFKRSSLPSEDALAVDASTMLLWRYPPQRVEAEVIRDGILQASGKLDPTLGGRSFRIHNVKKTYSQWQVVNNHGPHTWRRMLYQERMRRVDDKIFTAFDFPDCGQVRAKRPVSTTPLQALNLMNSDFVVEQSAFIAERAQKDASNMDEAIRRVFELLLTRQPAADELAACLHVANKQGLATVCRSLINTNEFAFLP